MKPEPSPCCVESCTTAGMRALAAAAAGSSLLSSEGAGAVSLFVVGVDSTIVNIALPSIQRSFGASTAGLQWTIDAYTVVLASLLMLSGSLADRLGRRRVFQAGLALFTVGSLLCSLAPGLGWLIAFRMLQAVGGSMLNPVALAIIANTFTDPVKRARAMGVWGSVFGISLAVGPVLGGVLVGTVGWRSLIVVVITVLDPFPDIAVHIAQPKCIWRE